MNNHSVHANDHSCVTILKRFKSPITDYYKELIKLCKGPSTHSIDNNIDFYLRFFFPKNYATTPHARPERLIIMFNGLNEIYPRHLSFYDRLGHSFASRGIASVLLPTPFHLNRAAVSKKAISEFGSYDKIPESTRYFKIPSNQLLRNPFYMYMNFIQVLHEYHILRKLIACEFDQIVSTIHYDVNSPDENDRSFYEQFTKSDNLQVSVLGYSLGGLMALMCFADCPDIVKSCVLLNSGAPLNRMKLKGMIDDNAWEGVTERLKNLEKEKNNRLLIKFIHHDPLFAQITDIFFGDPLFSSDTIERIGRKLILIIGGKDKIIPPAGIRRLEPEGYGLNTLQIAELGHFISEDVAFNVWYPRVIRILTDFLQESDKSAISSSEALNGLLLFHGLCGCQLLSLDAHPTQPFNMVELKNILKRCLTSVIPSDTLAKIIIVFKEVLKIARIYAHTDDCLISKLRSLRNRQRLLFGALLLENLSDVVVKEEISYVLEKAPYDDKVGDVLVKNKLIPNRLRDHILLVQLTNYQKLLEVAPHLKNDLDPAYNAVLGKAIKNFGFFQ